MLKQFLEVGKIVGTHGLNGEVRVECWCDGPEFLCYFKNLYYKEGAEKIQIKGRPHKNIALVKIKGVDTIEQADMLRGTVLYINRDDIIANPQERCNRFSWKTLNFPCKNTSILSYIFVLYYVCKRRVGQPRAF